MAGSSNARKKTTGSEKKSSRPEKARTGNTKKGTAKTRGRSGSAAQTEPNNGLIQSEAVILISFAACVFLFLSNFHICGTLGDLFSSMMLGVFGSIGYAAPVLLFLGFIFYASNKGNMRAVYKMLAVEGLLIALCGLFQLMFGGGYKEGQTLKEIYDMAGRSGLGGGIIGGILVLLLHKIVGTIGAYLVLLVLGIISMVCITERSFVSAVRRGSGKAYNLAKEDYGRRKELREEKQRLRSEQKVQGVDLASTDLSKTPAIPAAEPKMQTEPAQQASPFKPENARIPEASEMDLTDRSRSGKVENTVEAPVSKEDPADVFHGTILHNGKDSDDDVFISRNSSDFDAMDVFNKENPEQDNDYWLDSELDFKEDAFDEDWDEIHELTEKQETDLQDSEVTERDAYDQYEADVPDEAEIPRVAAAQSEADIQNEAATQREAKPQYETDLRSETDLQDSEVTERDAYSQYEAEVPDEAEIPRVAATQSEAADQSEAGIRHEPVIRGSEAPSDRKRVVTATGKIIETDAEEILRQKTEKKKAEAKEDADESVLKEIKKTEEKPRKPYVIPPLSLLNKGPEQVSGQSDREYRETAIKLQQTLKNFGVGVTVTNISCGPTVTRYELHPEQGVKVSKIQSLADDIKLNLAATDIRIEAPIPGKAAVGIEVPNKTNSIVYLRGLLESEEFRKHPSRLAFVVGKDIGGQTIVADLAKMPHLLIAGQTGSGKSVGINTMIMSLIYRSSPDDVKLIMIDPKVVELSVYNGIPHLLIPVVTDPKKAAGALNWAVAEMMERYNKFAQANVRDLKGYNARIKGMEEAKEVSPEKIPSKLPQLVIIIDELADLMMVASGEVEDAICRLAQLARAAGIHLVIATQRPSVNVITGVIKANVPSRIAFSVASGVDSRTILDMNGAEKLLGNGDMLFYPSGYPKPIRVQGAFVSDNEVASVTEYIKEQNEDTCYNKEIEKKMTLGASAGGSGGGSDRDLLFTDAGRFIIEKDKATIGMLQRMFKIGFNRAARIMDQLAEAGVVGEEEGTKPRKILMSMEQFEELLESGY